MNNSRLWQVTGLVAVFVLMAATAACGSDPPPPDLTPAVTVAVGETVVPRNGRLLGIDLTTPQEDDYDAAVQLAQSAGAEVASLTVFWDEIERQPGLFDPDPNWLEIANLYYPTQDMGVSLVVAVLDTTNKRLPPDLMDRPLDDPEVAGRFEALLDYIAAKLPELSLVSLSIGNEVDVFLGDDEAAWDAYGRFYAETADHARSLWPGLPIGVKAQLPALTTSHYDQLQALNATSDVILATYYPLGNDFMVRDPTVVGEDFDALVDAYPDRPVYLHEIGYPSSPTNGSSEARQAAFVHELFLAWDRHVGRIPLLMIVWLTDLPNSAVSELEGYYGLQNPGFAEYLRTLGLRTYGGAGTDKAAFRQVQQETAVRGWNGVP